MGIYVKKKGAYGSDQTEKMGAFRAKRTIKVVPFGKNGCIQKKVGALGANRTEKVGAFRANKTKKGGFTAAHTRAALIWEYPLRE